ncbi:type III-B CRISPR module RAMP protein Cmr6 [Thauera butanivorans]|uniref:type III-B CRISPR module RAMP protein Cmr6 n=1 Tax=Thauera butanivorans TaxID=86174 RepID=UPI000ADCB479|nr:type III-B CRISPR module RAMP protein Cmr6 [Thauera butanivorans]
MPIAAVPAYLGKDFSTASPGLRFGMYLPLWGINRRTGELLWSTSDVDYAVRGQAREERPIKVENKTSALQQACKLTTHDKAAMQALVQRQVHIATATPHLLTLDAIATAPFTTGLGNEHPLENGFAFLNPYGLPYLPGSGIKGVLRQAARELASGEWGDTHGWSEEKIHELEHKGKRIDLSMLDTLFGLESDNGSTQHVRGALSFWDAIPHIQGDSLAVDIMTPHQSHYYQQKTDNKSGGSASPHDSGQPNPISFLTLPPGTRFAFHVQCDLPHLERLAPDLAADDRWKDLLTAAFEHAFEWLGFGAKTTVGYGAMQVDEKITQQRKEAERERQQQAREEERRKTLTPAMLAIDDFVAELRAKHEQYPNLKEKPNANFHNKARALAKTADSPDWSADEKRSAAEAIETWLPKLVQIDIKDERKKLKLNALKGL